MGRYIHPDSPEAASWSPYGDDTPSRRPKRAPQLIGWRPFPVDRLPKALRMLAAVGAEQLGVDPTFIVLPGLAVAATAIGNTRRIRANESWTEPATFWAAVVGKPGTRKTPAFKLAMAPLEAHQDELDVLHDGDDDAPRRACFVTDVTLARLAGILHDNPRGVGMLRDELSSWFGMLTRHRKEGSDAADWLELYNDGRLHIHRKTAEPKYLAVRNANVSIFGSIQPEVLQRCLGNGNVENGLASRFLFAQPPSVLNREFPQGVDLRTRAEWEASIERLLALEFQDGEQATAVVLELSDDAAAIWRTFYAGHQERTFDAGGPLAAAYSKLERYTLRLALIFHLIETAAQKGDDTAAVTGEAMQRAVDTVDWFCHEAERIYGHWGRQDEQVDAERAFHWLEARGGRGTIREMLRQRLFDDAFQAEQALAELDGMKLVTIETTTRPGPGRPSTEWVLCSPP